LENGCESVPFEISSLNCVKCCNVARLQLAAAKKLEIVSCILGISASALTFVSAGFCAPLGVVLASACGILNVVIFVLKVRADKNSSAAMAFVGNENKCKALSMDVANLAQHLPTETRLSCFQLVSILDSNGNRTIENLLLSSGAMTLLLALVRAGNPNAAGLYRSLPDEVRVQVSITEYPNLRRLAKKLDELQSSGQLPWQELAHDGVEVSPLNCVSACVTARKQLAVASTIGKTAFFSDIIVLAVTILSNGTLTPICMLLQAINALLAFGAMSLQFIAQHHIAKWEIFSGVHGECKALAVELLQMPKDENYAETMKLRAILCNCEIKTIEDFAGNPNAMAAFRKLLVGGNKNALAIFLNFPAELQEAVAALNGEPLPGNPNGNAVTDPCHVRTTATDSASINFSGRMQLASSFGVMVSSLLALSPNIHCEMVSTVLAIISGIVTMFYIALTDFARQPP
jgi:hypothetical protein